MGAFTVILVDVVRISYSSLRVTAPEYALDEMLNPASDMYSLGCLMYAVHSKGNPPFKTHGSLGAVREHAGKPIPAMERLDSDLRGMSPRTLPIHISDEFDWTC